MEENKVNTTKQSRPKRTHVPKNIGTGTGTARTTDRPTRRRVQVDRDVEVVVVSNSTSDVYFENARMAQIIDLKHINDEEYITVGDLRTILNVSREILEGFDLLITEVLSDEFSLEDVLLFLGLDKKYDEYYSLTRKKQGTPAEVKDIRDFLINAPVSAFEKTMKNIDPKLRAKVISTSVTLFKLKEFGDYNKMSIIQEYVNDDLFDDAKTTEIDEDVYI